MNTLSTSQRNRTPEAKGNTKTAGIILSGIRTISASFLILICSLLCTNSAYSQTCYTGGDGSTYGVNQWIGYVYTNDSWTGYMGYYYAPANFSYNWGSGSPGPFGSTYMSDNDYFWIRHKMTKTFETGVYKFEIIADDAAKVSTNGGSSWNVLDDWDCSGTVNTTVNSIILSGSHNLIFEYAECSAYANAAITITQTCQMPGPPQNPTGVGTGLTTATLSWNAGSPAGSSAVYSIYVYRASDNVLVQSHYRATSLLTYNLTGLTANTQYYYKIKSEPSCWANWTAEVTSNSFYTGIIPGTPLTPSATATGPTTASLSWAAGSPAGNPAPTYYWVLKNSGGATVTSGNTTGTSASVTGLTTNTTYYFTVYASNNVGSSATATSANMVTLPVTPTIVTATPSTIAVGSSSNLNATSAGNTIDWYTASTGGTTLGSIASGANFAVAPATTTTYYAEAVGQATNTDQVGLLNTPNSWSYQYGTMFNVTAIDGNRAVTGFRADVFQGAGNLKVYYKTGSYSGYETNSSAWTYLGQYTPSIFTDIPDITIPSGSTYAFYIFIEGGSIITSSTTGTSSNSRVSVTTGSLTSSLFGGVSSGSLYGTVYYGDRGAASASRTSVALTVVQAPTTQASNVVFSSVVSNQFTASWTNGNGTSRAVFIKAASSGNAAPVNAASYTANTTFGSGTQIGSSGWYCVYNGTGSSVTVTGLIPNTAYQLHVCEYNGSTGTQAYNTASATNNPKSQTTAIPTISSFTPTSASTGTSVVITGTYLTGATAVSFGGTPAISFTVNSATQITAVVGGGTTGSVSVTTAGGIISLAGFTFTLPAAPTGVTATPSTIAAGNSSNLNATSAGNTINWYTVSTGGTAVGSSASGVNYSVTPASTTTYYAETFMPSSGSTALPLATSAFAFASGAMFDVTTLTAARVITGFSFSPSSIVSGVQQIKVYYKSGTYVGFQTNSASWTYLGQFNSDGQAGTSLLDITDLTIPAGTTYAFYLMSNSTGGLEFASGASTYADGSLSAATGSMLDGLFNYNNNNVSFRGSILHAIPSQTSATRTSVGVTVTQAPATQASGVAFSSVGSSLMTSSWTNGNGTSRAVFIKAGSSGTAAPVNTTSYTASTAFGSGTQIGSTGWYCVYNGSGTSVTVTGLSANTAYQVHVCEYNGTAGNQMYNTSSATNNPKSQTTATPTISTIGTLSAFSTCSGSASSSQSFTASGSYLNANITVTAPTGFEVSLASGSGFASSITLTQSGGTVSNTSVYVRLTSSATGSPSGNVTLASTGATTQNVAVSGTVSQAPTTATAGPDQTGSSTCGLTQVTLAANSPSVGTGAWSIISGSGGTVTTPSSPASTFTGTAGSTYTLRWTISNNPCTASTDDVTITFNRAPTTAAAGPDQTGSSTCGLTQVTLAANTPTVGTGAWSIVSGTGGSVTTPSSPTSTFTGTAGSTYTLRWTISNNPCTASTDDVVITFNRAPTTAAAGPDQTGSSTCGLTQVTLAANSPSVGTGAWSIISGSGGTVTTPSSPTSTFSGTAGSTYTLRWTISNSPCTASTDDVTITFNRAPTTAAAGPDQTGSSTCGLTQVTLAANSPSVGTGAWSIISGSGGTVTTPSSPTSTFSGTAGSTYTLRWTISNSPCTASFDEVDITFNAAASVSAGTDQTICAYTTLVTLNGSVSGSASTGAWSGGNGTFSPNNTTLNATYTPTDAERIAGSVTLTLTSDDPAGPCSAASDEMQLTINSCTKTTAQAGNWNSANTWTPSGAPMNTEDVTINHAVIVSDNSSISPAICRNITISSEGSVTVNPAQALTVDGTLTNSSASKLVVESGGSLIENSGVAATVKRNIVAGEWHLISAPVSDATAGMFSGYYLQKHTESSSAYTDITSINEALTPMRGYALYGDANLPTATFAGLLNAGAKSFSTTAETYTIGPPENGGWNLVGNPYPSSIDWMAIQGWTKTNINTAIYTHIDANSWATYNNGAFTNGGSQYIAPCQGFFVQATTAGELAMTDAVRVHNNTTFFKNANSVPNLIRLQVSGNGYKDEAVVRFVPEATAEFDGNYDAHKLFGDAVNAAQLYTTGTGQLSINSLPETSMVPVGVKTGTTGSYTIAATEINDMPYVSLEDTKTGIFTELAKSSYTFNFTSGENELRFKLHFSALSVNEEKEQQASIYSYRKTAYINLNTLKQADIYIYNTAGQLIYTRESAGGLISINMETGGVYIVKVISNNDIQTKKIFINQ